MRITIKNANIDKLLAINPNHFSGQYLDVITNGVIEKKMSADNACTLTANVYATDNEDQLNLDYVAGPSIVCKLLSCFCRPIFSLNKEEWDNTYLDFAENFIKNLDGETEIIVTGLWLENPWSDLLEKHYGFILTKDNYLYRVNLKGDNLYDTILVLNLCMLALAAKEKSVYINEDQVEKTLRHLNSMPYFMAYVFGQYLFYTESSFLKFKEKLESLVKNYHNYEEVQLTQGNTHELRHKAIINNLDLEGVVLDVGCGEMRLAKAMKRKFKGKYIGYDIEDYSKEAEYLQARGVNAFFINILEPIETNVQVVLSEVIEHVSGLDELMNNVLQWDIKSIHITTPNVSFNKHYGLTGYRLPDHVREMNKEEFHSFLNKYPQFTWEIKSIGDIIDKDFPSFYAHGIKKI